MARVVIECAQCGATLGVPQKKNTVECPICSNKITLAFHPAERHTPSWLRMELGLIIVVVSLLIWTNSSWLEGYLFEGAEDLLVGVASWSCFGGVLLVAFAGLIRNRDRVMGDRGSGESYGRGFYVGLLLPLLMSLVAMLIPPVFNLCRWASEGPCNVIGHNNVLEAIELCDLSAFLLHTANNEDGVVVLSEGTHGRVRLNELIGADITGGDDHAMLFTDEGKAIRFRETDVREMGRTARGVREQTKRL